MAIEKALKYCRSSLQNVSRSFALTIPFIEKNILVPILVGYLEARVMDSFEDENTGKEIDSEKRAENINKIISIIKDPESLKSQKHIEDIGIAANDFISNPHYLDLAQNMDKVIILHKTMDQYSQSSISFWFGRMAEGMEKYLNTRIDTFEQLDEYCYYVGGTVGGFVTDLLIKNTIKADSSSIDILRMKSDDFGLFLQKVNIIRDFREDIIRNEKIFWPYQIFHEQEIIPHQTLDRLNEEKSMIILEKMISDATKHIGHVRNYINAVPEDYPGYKRFCMVNFLMAVETINKMKNNPDVFYSDSPIKIEKSVKDRIIENPSECFESVC